MSADPLHEQLIARIRRDMVDSWDEELEMDIEDYHPLPDLPDGGASDPHEKEYRKNEQPAAASATLFGRGRNCGPLLLRHSLVPIEECLR